MFYVQFFVSQAWFAVCGLKKEACFHIRNLDFIRHRYLISKFFRLFWFIVSRVLFHRCTFGTDYTWTRCSFRFSAFVSDAKPQTVATTFLYKEEAAQVA